MNSEYIHTEFKDQYNIERTSGTHCKSPSHPSLYTPFPHPPCATTVLFLGEKASVSLCQCEHVPSLPVLLFLPRSTLCPSPPSLCHCGLHHLAPLSYSLLGSSQRGCQQELGEQEGRRAGRSLGGSFVALHRPRLQSRGLPVVATALPRTWRHHFLPRPSLQARGGWASDRCQPCKGFLTPCRFLPLPTGPKALSSVTL